MMDRALAVAAGTGSPSAVGDRPAAAGGARPFGEARLNPSAYLAPHACGVPGARMLFVREASGHSFERCSGCKWSYDFDRGRVSDAAAPSVLVGPA